MLKQFSSFPGEFLCWAPFGIAIEIGIGIEFGIGIVLGTDLEIGIGIGIEIELDLKGAQFQNSPGKIENGLSTSKSIPRSMYVASLFFEVLQ